MFQFFPPQDQHYKPHNQKAPSRIKLLPDEQHQSKAVRVHTSQDHTGAINQPSSPNTMSDPDPMMTPVFPEGTRIVYETEKHKQFKGAIRSATRITGTDFFKYTVDLFEEKQASR